jgi:hypothetical protein
LYLTNIEKFEDFHLEAEGGVDKDENEVGHLGHVHHHVDVVRALDEGQAALLAGNYGHGSLQQVGQILTEN